MVYSKHTFHSSEYLLFILGRLWDVSSATVVASILTTSTSMYFPHIYDVTRSHILTLHSGSSSLAPDCKTLLLAMQRGYDIHHLETHVPLVSIPHDLHEPGPVTFLHTGLALLGASSRGEVSLWNSADGEKLQDMKQNCKQLPSHTLW